MKTLVYSSKDFEIPFLKEANASKHDLKFVSERLTSQTAMMAVGYEAISIFSADDASVNVLEKLKDFGVKFITLRSAGHDNVNLKTANRLHIKVANAPDYSPNAVAEHAIGLMQAINRKLLIAARQTINYDFSLTHLVGSDLVGKTVGICGTGRIGSVIARIMYGFGSQLLAYDLKKDKRLITNYGVKYTDLNQLCIMCDVIFLTLPLNSETHRIIDRTKLELMKDSALLINVARGGIINTRDVVEYVEENRIGGYATDVYEKENGVFFHDRSKDKPDDPLLNKLLSHDRIILTPHQAFATREALQNIAWTTINNLSKWKNGKSCENELKFKEKVAV